MLEVMVGLALAIVPADDGVCDIAGATSSDGCVWWRDEAGHLWPADPTQPNEGRPNGAGSTTSPAPATSPGLAPATPTQLAHTGVRTAPYLVVSGALVAGGVGLVLLKRRRLAR